MLSVYLRGVVWKNMDADSIASVEPVMEAGYLQSAREKGEGNES